MIKRLKKNKKKIGMQKTTIFDNTTLLTNKQTTHKQVKQQQKNKNK